MDRYISHTILKRNYIVWIFWNIIFPIWIFKFKQNKSILISFYSNHKSLSIYRLNLFPIKTTKLSKYIFSLKSRTKMVRSYVNFVVETCTSKYGIALHNVHHIVQWVKQYRLPYLPVNVTRMSRHRHFTDYYHACSCSCLFTKSCRSKIFRIIGILLYEEILYTPWTNSV